MRTPGATTLLSRSMSANTHSSLGEVMRKSPLNSAWRPYRKGSRLPDYNIRRTHSEEGGTGLEVSYTGASSYAAQPVSQGCVFLFDVSYLADML